MGGEHENNARDGRLEFSALKLICNSRDRLLQDASIIPIDVKCGRWALFFLPTFVNNKRVTARQK